VTYARATPSCPGAVSMNRTASGEHTSIVGQRIPRAGRAPVIGPKRNRGIVINERPKDIPESHPRPRHDSRPDQLLFVATDVHTLLPVRKSQPTTGYSTPALNQPFEAAVRDLPSASFSTDAGNCTTRLDLRARARSNQPNRLARRVRVRSRWRPSVIAAPATIITTLVPSTTRTPSASPASPRPAATPRLG
jgi:hypothetical protein